jgi:hypothetical protein
MQNCHLLIPNLLKNIEKLDFKNSDRYLIHNALQNLPALPDSELNYIFYSENTHYVIYEFIKLNYNRISGEDLPEWGLSKWFLDTISGNIMSYYVLDFHKKDSSFLETLYEKSNSYFLLNFLIVNSVYTGTNCLKHLSKKDDVNLQLLAVISADLETIRSLTKSPYDKVRLKAYERVGIMDHLDEMLVDKSRLVRGVAAKWMPMGYRVPQKALSDRAYWSFAQILDKVSLDQIPMLLANKNLIKNKHLAVKLQARLDSKI